MANDQKQHFLVVTVNAQGHINPAIQLARRLALTGPAIVTLAASTSAYRRMFPSSSSDHQLAEDGLVSYTHYSDGIEDGLHFSADFPQIKLRVRDSLARLTGDLAARGRPVTCIAYTLALPVASEVARDLGIPSVLLWVQPATVFAIGHRYFHGFAGSITARTGDPSFLIELPGIQPPLRTRDLPSFLTMQNPDDLDKNPYATVYHLFCDLFRSLDREAAPTRVLVNTFRELEPDVLSGIIDGGIEMIPIGPMALLGLEESYGGGGGGSESLFEESQGYLEWMESKTERSLVYVSFGSMSKLSREQKEEISRGLRESGRPYLWVVRGDNRDDGGEEAEEINGTGTGMVVEWCSQIRVLSHSSVGCFVTHCGWNSTLESIACGVPMVMVPQWADQPTNARLAEAVWGTGVRADLSEDGLLKGSELKRCISIVMGEDGEIGAEIRERARMWQEKANAAVGEGGSSSENLKEFLHSRLVLGRNT